MYAEYYAALGCVVIFCTGLIALVSVDRLDTLCRKYAVAADATYKGYVQFLFASTGIAVLVLVANYLLTIVMKGI